MDTSLEYIKMCRQAETIQEEGRKTGAFNRKHAVIKYVSEGCGNVCVWLPNQDQLQNMLPGEPFDKLRQLHVFAKNISYNYSRTDLNIFKTPEQSWLAFVMYKKFGKIWNGQEWRICSPG